MTAMNGEAWGIWDAAAMVAAIDAELGRMAARHETLLAKGRIDPRVAAYHADLAGDIRADLAHCFGPFDPAKGWERPPPVLPWRDKVRWIGAELDERREKCPDLVAKGRMTEADAADGIHLFGQLRRLYWNNAFMWEPEEEEARAYVLALRSADKLDEARIAELRAGPGYRRMQEAMRAHLVLLEQESGDAQGRLVA